MCLQIPTKWSTLPFLRQKYWSKMIALVKTKEIFTSKHLDKKLVFLELLHRLQLQNNYTVEDYFFAFKKGEDRL